MNMSNTLFIFFYIQEVGLLAEAKVFSKTKFSMMTSELLAELDADGKDVKKQVMFKTTIFDLSFIHLFIHAYFLS
jgi:hypothetical protein